MKGGENERMKKKKEEQEQECLLLAVEINLHFNAISFQFINFNSFNFNRIKKINSIGLEFIPRVDLNDLCDEKEVTFTPSDPPLTQ